MQSYCRQNAVRLSWCARQQLQGWRAAYTRGWQQLQRLTIDSKAGKAKVTYALNKFQADQWLINHAGNALQGHSIQRFGFDAEWWPFRREHQQRNFDLLATPADRAFDGKSKTAEHTSVHQVVSKSLVNAVQLAVRSQHAERGQHFEYAVLVYHLAHFNSNLSDNSRIQVSEKLCDLMQSDHVELVGVGADTDADRLARTGLSVRVGAVHDSAVLAYKALGMHTGLGRLARQMLGEAPWKSKKLAMSDWRRSPLSDGALRYAAKDALFSLQVHDALLMALGQNPLEGMYAGNEGISGRQAPVTQVKANPGSASKAASQGSPVQKVDKSTKEAQLPNDSSDAIAAPLTLDQLEDGHYKHNQKTQNWQAGWRKALEYTLHAGVPRIQVESTGSQGSDIEGTAVSDRQVRTAE